MCVNAVGGTREDNEGESRDAVGRRVRGTEGGGQATYVH